ncbi:MAG: hypothetical protein B7733_25445 [Myxococcales bacterium FL481]|nr:MAG: hypothetical protein B7733_25445 [Myxococcales bacterium FL481]
MTVPHLARCVALVCPLLACGPKIGDACGTDRDCAAQGVFGRTCDLSFQTEFDGKKSQGECIIEDCSYRSCPDDEDSVCVLVYSTQFLSVTCDPEKEDQDGGPNDCAPNEICLREGLCADQVSARSSCRLECSGNGDCRPGYRCQQTDVDGVYVMPNPDDPTAVKITSICVPDR